jgi:hypothetical protein
MIHLMHNKLYCVFFFALYFYVHLIVCAKEESFKKLLHRDLQSIDWFAKGRCKGNWRPDKLVGRCFGLTPHSTYPELAHISSMNKSSDCRALCCNYGSKCVTWQYESTEKVCKIGREVRLGLEDGGSPFWCDPFPPAEWSGRRLESRGMDGTCKWSSERLKVQCFGLGAERLNSTQGSLTNQQCGEQCCADPKCEIWQEMSGRGCYFSAQKGVTCNDDRPSAFYEGSRKCIQDHCGGMEAKYLKPLKY